MPFAFAARTTCSTLSSLPMLPGLMRTAATPASIARSARLALKWMSAITGIGEKRTIFGSASASSLFGTATRTISQPALARAAICAVVASMSCVFVSVIDWTTGAAPPPIRTPPTLTERSLATRLGYRAHGASSRDHDPPRQRRLGLRGVRAHRRRLRPGYCPLRNRPDRGALEPGAPALPGVRGRGAGPDELTPAAAEEVVAKAEIHEDGEERQPDDRVAHVDGLPERAPAQLLDECDHNVAAVERQHRNQVEQAERKADHPEHEQEVAQALTPRGCRDAD